MLQTEAYQADKRTWRMRKWHRTRKLMRKNWVLYLFLLPAVLYIGVFHYAPMYGVQLAFKDFSPSLGVWGSPYVGMKYFNMFFKSPRFKMLLVNTIVVSAYNLLLGFPAPVILALLLHYTPNMYLKKFAQTVTYAPHFISTVILVGLVKNILSMDGIINTFIEATGGEPILFMSSPEWFRTIYIVSGLWQGVGWGTIIYLAALAGVSPELYEAAIIDGANRWQQMRSVTLPSIMPTVVVLMILNVQGILNSDTQKILLMYNTNVYETADVIGTYVYREGIESARYAYSAAVGLMTSLVSLLLVVVVNSIARGVSEYSLW